MENARFMLLRHLEPLIIKDDATHLAWLSASKIEAIRKSAPPPVLLGLEKGAPRFTLDVSDVEDTLMNWLPIEGYAFEDARIVAASDIPLTETGILSQGRSQVNWHARHKFCSVCGKATHPLRGGELRQCSACETQHFPRTDPVVIMLVHLGDRCVLGQTKRRSSLGHYSCLAGFVDQGETIEEAVKREVMEESGIKVSRVRYHSSQPWPFPSSLMIGCHAEAATTDIRIEYEELEDVRWFTRNEIRAALFQKSTTLKLPTPIAIAHHLIKSWAESEE